METVIICSVTAPVKDSPCGLLRNHTSHTSCVVLTSHVVLQGMDSQARSALRERKAPRISGTPHQDNALGDSLILRLVFQGYQHAQLRPLCASILAKVLGPKGGH